MSRISTNAHLDDLDKLLDNSEAHRSKENINVSPARVKKFNEPASYIYGNDPFGYKKINNGGLGVSGINPRPINPMQNNPYSSSMKVESPFRKKDDKNDIIDRIMHEHKEKFSDPFDFGSRDKYESKANKVYEKDFELFDSDKKKQVNIGSTRKRSGVKYGEEAFNEGKKIDFESRRRNKMNEMSEKDNMDSYERKKGIDQAKYGGINYGAQGGSKKENDHYFFQKY